MAVAGPIRRWLTRKNQEGDGGFILITLGLLLIPIMIFTAFAVDISSWYTRAANLQQAADSASLAGVVWMPKIDVAKTNATTVLAKNGIADGVDDMTVTILPGTGQNSLRVCVTDNSPTQYFAAVFTKPTPLKRCATAQYNVPLQLGSPLNYFGGNKDLVGYQPGPQPANAQTPVPQQSAFGGGRYCQVRDPYPSGSIVGYWDNHEYINGHYDPTRWNFVVTNVAQTMPNCGTSVSVPDPTSFLGQQYCTVVIGGKNVATWDSTGGPSYNNRKPANSHPTCGWGGTGVQPIPNEKSPGMWASVLGPDNSRVNGDIVSTTNGGDNYRKTGYWYSIDIPDGPQLNDISVQVFDGSENCEEQPDGCRTTMGDEGTVDMHFAVYDSGTTPYDMSDDTPVCDPGSPPGVDVKRGTGAPYALQWQQLCKISSPTPGGRYYVNVYSTGGSGYNGYALRAVSGTIPAACMLKLPVGDVDCYGAAGSVQPALSAYGDMDVYNGITAGTPTQFFLANVKQVYAGKTLHIKLWDPGDIPGRTGDVTVQILMPGPKNINNKHEIGVPAPSCDWKRISFDGTLEDSGTANDATNGCLLKTTVAGDKIFDGYWADFLIDIDPNYKCDDKIDPTTTSGSCWWQIKYTTTSTTSDYTTWFAEIVGDPVRLTQ